MLDKFKVLFASSEVAPLAQTGGLAEVAGSLPQAITALGYPTTVIMPAYRQTLANFSFKKLYDGLKVPFGSLDLPFSILEGQARENQRVLLIKYDPFFDREGLYGPAGEAYPDNPARFAFFSKAIIETLKQIPETFDLVVANDWQTGLLMPLLNQFGPKAPAGLFIIHNQGFLGLAPAETAELIGLPESYYALEGMEYYGQLSYLKAGIVYSQAVVTVSPTYAREIQSPEFGNGLDGVLRLHSNKLSGIVNGVDYLSWNPETDLFISHNYSRDDFAGKAQCKISVKEQLKLPPSHRPLFSMVSRLTAQKGISLVIEAGAELFKLGLDLIILGTGEPWFEEQLRALMAAHPDNMRLILAYDNKLAHQIIAGSDFTLVPSIYEPCGLIQLYSLRYGTIPIVRAVGGLNDTVRDFAGANPEGLWDNGFKFSQFQPPALTRAVRRATELYRSPDFKTMALANMAEDHSWSNSAKEYLKIFRKLLAQPPAPTGAGA
ncbi:MAG: glycogen synthase GlgA [Deltaproteobacteria bacterium]|jgi:starch synthase|nr:glycogen synthase GlgA [Deltaproteobacteria bacterium]